MTRGSTLIIVTSEPHTGIRKNSAGIAHLYHRQVTTRVFPACRLCNLSINLPKVLNYFENDNTYNPEKLAMAKISTKITHLERFFKKFASQNAALQNIKICFRLISDVSVGNDIKYRLLQHVFY